MPVSRFCGVGDLLRRLWISLCLVLSALMLPAAHAQDTATAPPNSSEARTDPYRINAGDELEVHVWGDERLQRVVKVLPDGTFSFPLVGRIVAEGYLPSDVEQFLTEGLRDQYRGQIPQVTVSVNATSGMQFSVMGRVNAPGTFSPSRYVNVLEALSMAGGPTEFANLDNVVIIRKVGDELHPVRLRLAPLFERGATARDINNANIVAIHSGDTVIVP